MWLSGQRYELGAEGEPEAGADGWFSTQGILIVCWRSRASRTECSTAPR